MDVVSLAPLSLSRASKTIQQEVYQYNKSLRNLRPNPCQLGQLILEIGARCAAAVSEKASYTGNAGSLSYPQAEG